MCTTIHTSTVQYNRFDFFSPLECCCSIHPVKSKVLVEAQYRPAGEDEKNKRERERESEDVEFVDCQPKSCFFFV